jgi:hypothetical protein
MTKTQISRRIRNRIDEYLFDDSGVSPNGTAIYTLSDPRDIRLVRYVGQTASPHRRFMQHIDSAKLWLPDETPWEMTPAKLRPLYEWIRELYRDEFRVPVMVIVAWTECRDALLEERNYIYRCLRDELPLLNWERELLGQQKCLI